MAVVVVGDVETEGQDKDCIDLNCANDLANSNAVLFTSGSSCAQQSCPLNGTNEDGLISTVAAAQPKTVVVLETGAPVLTPWRAQVPAILEAWYPGQEGGTAIARVLFGDVDPGGRLPVTFPADASQLPTAGDPTKYPGVAETENYSEGMLIGYKWYDAHNLTPAFPFGYGLSYTSFRYGPLRVSATPGANQVATATLDVTNTGARAGFAVPELYISKPATGALPQAPRQLVGYDSVSVPAGRTVRVTFPLNDRAFASWDTNGWTVLPGCYTLAAGSSSRSLPSQAVIARGAGCSHASAQLGTSASVVPPRLADGPREPAAGPTAARSRPRVRLRSLGASARRHGLVVAVSTTTGVLRHVTIELKRGRRIRATVRVARLGTRTRRLVLRVHGHAPGRGRYTIVVLTGHRTVLRRTVTVR